MVMPLRNPADFALGQKSSGQGDLPEPLDIGHFPPKLYCCQATQGDLASPLGQVDLRFVARFARARIHGCHMFSYVLAVQ